MLASKKLDAKLPATRSKLPATHAASGRVAKRTSHSAGRPTKPSAAGRYRTADDEVEVHDAHNDLDRCASLLDSLMQATAQARPRPSTARGRSTVGSRSAVGDQSMQSRHPVATASGAHPRSRSWTRPAVGKKFVVNKKPSAGNGNVSRPQRMASVPVRGISASTAKQATGAANALRHTTSLRGTAVAGQARPPSELEWTFDSGNEGGIVCAPRRHVRRRSEPDIVLASRRAVPSEAHSSHANATSGTHLPRKPVPEAAGQFGSMETTDLLQALLTRTIDTGDSVLQEMVVTLCSTVLKPWIVSDPSAVPPKAELSCRDTSLDSRQQAPNSDARNSLKSENTVLKRKLQEALHKAQLAKERLKGVEARHLEALSLKENIASEQELTVALRQQLANKTAELDQLIQSSHSDKIRLQTKISSLEAKVRQRSSLDATATSGGAGGAYSYLHHMTAPDTISTQSVQSSSSTAASKSIYNSLTAPRVSAYNNPRPISSVGRSDDQASTIVSSTADRTQTAEESSSFMRLPATKHAIVTERHTVLATGGSGSSDSGSRELTVANVLALGQAYPSVKLSDQRAAIPTSPYLPDNVPPSQTYARMSTSTGGNTLRGAGLRGASSDQPPATHVSPSAAASAAIAGTVGDSSLSSLDTVVPSTGTGTGSSRLPATVKSSGVLKTNAVLKLGAGLADLISVSDVTGSGTAADEDFQVGIAALDAGIARLRQQLHSTTT